MSGSDEPIAEALAVKRYHIQYPLSAYTFPTQTPRIREVRLDDRNIHIHLVDGRSLSIPLSWIPSLFNAEPAEREKYMINRGRTGLIWDPETCDINDELFIADYLGPYSRPESEHQGSDSSGVGG